MNKSNEEVQVIRVTSIDNLKEVYPKDKNIENKIFVADIPKNRVNTFLNVCIDNEYVVTIICEINNMEDFDCYKKFFDYQNINFYFRTWFIEGDRSFEYKKVVDILQYYDTIKTRYKRSLIFPKDDRLEKFRNTKDYELKEYHIVTEQDYKVLLDDVQINESKKSRQTYLVKINNFQGNLLLLQEFLLIAKQYLSYYNEFVLDITGQDLKTENMYFVLKCFLYAMLDSGIIAYYNGKKVLPDITSAGKLVPAIFFGKDFENKCDLLFFQKPLPKYIWKKICSDKPITNHTQFKDNGKKDDMEYYAKKFWYCLRICQKFLVEFQDNITAKQYSRLRKDAFLNKSFYDDYVSRMPFLALYIFSVYDSLYRTDSILAIRELKSKYNFVNEDLLLSEQAKQKYEMYTLCENLKTERGIDVKNLFADYDKNNIRNNKLHQTVVAEIFESIAIAEGLLQILENAVLHSDGCVCSIRIYSRAKNKLNEYFKRYHCAYLDKTYSKKYFEHKLENNKNSNYYLEVQISDLPKNLSPTNEDNFSADSIRNLPKGSIPYKFYCNNCKNIKNDIAVTNDKNKALKNETNYDPMEKAYNEGLLNLEYFFNPNSQQKNNKKEFYNSNNKNRVHHYGLEIFNNILTAREGLLAVGGYNDGKYLKKTCSYDNLDAIFDKVFPLLNNRRLGLEKETFNKICEIYEKRKNDIIESVRQTMHTNDNFLGTTYRILMPISHSLAHDSSFSNEINTSEDHAKGNYEIVEYKFDGSLELENVKSVKNKKENIESVCEDLTNKIKDFDRKVVCINFSNSLDCGHFEEKIKGILLFALNIINPSKIDDILPLAIIGLNSIQLIEAARIIALYYTKGKEEKGIDIFSKLNICLKGDDARKEIIFAGSNLNEVKNGLVKSAMTNGMMYEELYTIINIFERMLEK